MASVPSPQVDFVPARAQLLTKKVAEIRLRSNQTGLSLNLEGCNVPPLGRMLLQPALRRIGSVLRLDWSEGVGGVPRGGRFLASKQQPKWPAAIIASRGRDDGRKSEIAYRGHARTRYLRTVKQRLGILRRFPHGNERTVRENVGCLPGRNRDSYR